MVCLVFVVLFSLVWVVDDVEVIFFWVFYDDVVCVGGVVVLVYFLCVEFCELMYFGCLVFGVDVEVDVWW